MLVFDHSLNQRITATEFREYEVCVLEDIIISYLDERRELYEDFPDLLGTPKPKTHFLTHYPTSILLYGPPMAYWTARYESRHRIAKNAANSAKNYKNISKTISTRQQMRQSSVFYHGMFPTTNIVISQRATTKCSLKGKDMFEMFVLPYMSPSDFLCTELEVKSQVYKAGQLVVLEQLSLDVIKVGLIVSILVKPTSVRFVTQQYIAERENLQYFTASSENSLLAMQDVTSIADFKPLINHGTTSKIVFCLHHYISFRFP